MLRIEYGAIIAGETDKRKTGVIALMLYRDLKEEFGGPICRSCIIEETGQNITRSDCVYRPGEHRCPACGRGGRHLVERLKLNAKIRLLGK